jgi:hypothetical protein
MNIHAEIASRLFNNCSEQQLIFTCGRSLEKSDLVSRRDPARALA